MLVTHDGTVEDVSDMFEALWDALFMDTPDTLDDEAAERALDTICFLQDEDISTPISLTFASPWAEAESTFE